MTKLEKDIGIIMRIGVGVSVLFMLFGMILLIVNGQLAVDFTQGTMNMIKIFEGITKMYAGSYLALGVFCLILTPILRVVTSIAIFILERDKLYVVITIVVLAILLLCFILG